MTAVEYFDKRAKTYLRRGNRGIWKILRKREFGAVIRMLEPAPGTSLIDLGCGPGYYSIPLQKQFGINVLGVDASATMLESLSKQNVRTLLSPVEDLPDVGPFDNALAAGILEFLSKPEILFQRCYSVLSARGKLVVLVPASGAGGFIYKAWHDVMRCPAFIRSLAEYKKIAEQTGFSCLSLSQCTPISFAVCFEKNNAS